MTQHYSNPKRAEDPHALPDLEVFYHSKADGPIQYYGPDDEPVTEPGWYWWACFPGCLPDSEPCGPFASEAEALADAREGVSDNE